MDDSNKKEFAVLFYGVGELYDKTVSKELLQLYFNILKTYSIEQIKVGVNKHTLDSKSGSFFPKPADIAKHVTHSSDNKAELAWAQVIHQIRATGSYGALDLDDKQAIAAVRALGSWQQLCGTLEKDMTWKKKEFMSIYNTYENTPIEMLPSSLPGLIGLKEHKKQTNAIMDKIIAGIPKRI